MVHQTSNSNRTRPSFQASRKKEKDVADLPPDLRFFEGAWRLPVDLRFVMGADYSAFIGGVIDPTMFKT